MVTSRTPPWFDKLTMRAAETAVLSEDLMVSLSSHEVRALPQCLDHGLLYRSRRSAIEVELTGRE